MKETYDGVVVRIIVWEGLHLHDRGVHVKRQSIFLES